MQSSPWYRPVAVAADLAAHIATCWTVRTRRARDLVPDACIDLVWFPDGRIWVCGPETTGWTFAVPLGTEAIGLKFRPGHAGRALGFHAAELRNRQVPLEDYLGAATERMAADDFNSARDTSDRLRVVQSWAREWLRRAPERDPWADMIVHQLRCRIATPVSELAAATGLSERQIERRCDAAFGYGPATLRRILCLQRVLGLARNTSPPRSLARLAAHAGYADQQHLARDCRRIARTTPTALLAQPRSPA